MIDTIRAQMAQNGIDWLIVFSDDPHLSEYTAKCDKYREAISHFTGSAGTLLISANEAYLWTDMRYHIQASAQLDGSNITLMKYGMPDVESYEDFLRSHIWDGMTLGFDLMTASYETYLNLRQKLPESVDIVDAHGILRSCVKMPKRSFNPIEAVPDEYLGKSTAKKIEFIRNRICQKYISDESYTYILSDLASQMWLLGLRGSDIDYVPVAYSYTMITSYGVTVYMNKESLSAEAVSKLDDEGIKAEQYSQFYDRLDDIATDVVVADPVFNNSRLLSSFDERGMLIECDDTVLIPKAFKNSVETEGMISAHTDDAVTMIKFIRKIKEMAAKNILTDELSVKKMLDSMRIKRGCDTLSFETICAYAENAAIVHYAVNESSSKKIESRGFLLVDSGGQYKFRGTTDITRTISLGPLTDEQKRAYTTVLKGNLALMGTVFPEGFKGTMLDAIAEKPLWDGGYYCGHGIGHGVGCYLSVHESEARISRNPSKREVTFHPGIIISNEPGIYIEGQFGIRLENLLLVTRADPVEGHNMCRFTPLTLVPFDNESIDVSMLSDKELSILNDYNAMILEKCSPLLTEDEVKWLKENIDIK